MTDQQAKQQTSAECIVAAAIMHRGKLYTLPPPFRHHDIIRVIYERTGRPADGDQGFVTDAGRFVGREQAWRIANEAGQEIAAIACAPGILFSEHLW